MAHELARPAFHAMRLSDRQYFVAVSRTEGGGVAVALADGELAWRGSVSSADVDKSRPQHMAAAEFSQRLHDGLLGRGLPALTDRISLDDASAGVRVLRWQADIRDGLLELSLDQVGACCAPCRPQLQPLTNGLRAVAGDSAHCGRSAW